MARHGCENRREIRAFRHGASGETAGEAVAGAHGLTPPRGLHFHLRYDAPQAVIRRSMVYGHYEKTLDRESAYEKLRASVTEDKQSEAGKVPTGKQESAAQGGILGGAVGDLLFGRTGPRGGKTDGLVQVSAKSLARTIGSTVGRQIVRGVLGAMLGGKK
ncbi:MAG: DUF853 family protein [Smithellaceae bacterium]|nr:DUF853 family protein [Smithellaceae bacterium]